MLEVVYYTDPLCCWSWAFEKDWKRLLKAYESVMTVRYCMAGLIESWRTYNDLENCVTKPVQMGPFWMQASAISGVPIDSSIWVKDPPQSSYLACVAVKCAFMQSFHLGSAYLSLMRKELMLKGRNVAKETVLLSIAKLLAEEHKDFDWNRFRQSLIDGSGYKAFSEDLREVRFNGITRFPSLAISGNGKGLLITGYRNYDVLVKSIDQLLNDSALGERAEKSHA